MIYLLKIGYQTYAFPSNRGFQTVLETLSKARRVTEDTRGIGPGGGIELDDEPVRVSMECVHGISFVKGERKRDVIEPEVLPRQRDDEGDAAFAMRVAGKSQREINANKPIHFLRSRSSFESFERMIGEGK